MKILVANLGSTSFKYRLFDLADPAEPVLARGSVERIGAENARVKVSSPRGEREATRPVKDHGEAVQLCLDQLTDAEIGVLGSPEDVSAIGFKAVLGPAGAHRVDHALLDEMESLQAVAPAHNPIYVKAMRTLFTRFPALPLVAAFEVTFHRSIPEARQRYAVPDAWATELGVRRWGYHGASHRYIAERMNTLLGRSDARIISCHLGGSSSLCAVKDGRSMGCSLGMSPQSGLPHNNRVGDFDVFALPLILSRTGQTLDQVLDTLANRSGLEGLSGHRDLRDIESAAAQGDPGASLAINVFVESIRDYLGAFLVTLGGADAIVFTGGIGENSTVIRQGVCRDLGWFGIELDPTANASAKGEAVVSKSTSRVQLWTVPTNEEIIVARQARDVLLEASST